MATVARTLRLLALVVWVGGIIFFGAVFAPTAAHVLTPYDLGRVIGPSLHSLHSIGIVCGIALLLSLRLLGKKALAPLLQVVLAFAMIALTIISNRFILAPMEHDRALAGGYISALMPDAPLRKDFDARHHWSTRVEGGVLLCGVALCLLTAFETPREE